MTITLPLPHSNLSGNAGAHWAARQRQRRSHRQLAFFATLGALGVANLPTRILAKDKARFGIRGKLTAATYQRLSRLLRPLTPPRPSSYSLAYHFPQIRGRDDDNWSYAAKSYRDGIADALRMDDADLTQAGPPEMLVDRANPRLIITLHLSE